MDLFNSFQLPIKLPQKEGYSFSYNEELQLFEIDIPNGKLLYGKHFFNEKVSNRSIEYLLERI